MHCRRHRREPCQTDCADILCRAENAQGTIRAKLHANMRGQSFCEPRTRGHAPTQPSTASPSRVAPIAGSRLDRRNVFAPCCMHSARCGEENGTFKPSSIFGSFCIRNVTGSILRLTANSSISDSRANKLGTAPGPRIDVSVAMSRAWPMPDVLEHHLSTDHQFDRATRFPRCGCGKQRMRPRPQLAAETAAEILGDDAHPFVGHAQHLRHCRAVIHDGLRGFEERKAMAVE